MYQILGSEHNKWAAGTRTPCPTRRTSEHQIKARSIKRNFPWRFNANPVASQHFALDCRTCIIHVCLWRGASSKRPVCHVLRSPPSPDNHQSVSSPLFKNDSHSWRLKIACKSPSLAHYRSLLSLRRCFPLSPLLLSIVSRPAPPSRRIFHTNTPNWWIRVWIIIIGVLRGKKKGSREERETGKRGGGGGDDVAQLGNDELENVGQSKMMLSKTQIRQREMIWLRSVFIITLTYFAVRDVTLSFPFCLFIMKKESKVK